MKTSTTMSRTIQSSARAIPIATTISAFLVKSSRLRSSRTYVMSPQVAFDRGLDLIPGNGADDAPFFMSILEEDQQRDSLDLERRRGPRILIDIELREAD